MINHNLPKMDVAIYQITGERGNYTGDANLLPRLTAYLRSLNPDVFFTLQETEQAGVSRYDAAYKLLSDYRYIGKGQADHLAVAICEAFLQAVEVLSHE